MISCSSPESAAYRWQRNGGHAAWLLAEERNLVALPDELAYLDGAMVACGGGTAYAACLRADVSGRDVVLITGLDPVGLGTAFDRSGSELAQAPAFKKAPGGALANVAVGVARLGYHAGFIGQVGDDEFGYFLANPLHSHGVDITGLRLT